MRNDFSREDIQACRAALAAVKASLADLNRERQVAHSAPDDLAVLRAAFDKDAAAFNPKNDSDVAAFVKGQAVIAMRQLRATHAPARIEQLQAKISRDLRNLVEGLLPSIADVFESHLCPAATVVPFLNAQSAECYAPGAIAAAEKILAYRLPAHAPVSGATNATWVLQTYQALLKGATEP